MIDPDIAHKLASRLVQEHGDNAINLAVQWIDDAAQADSDHLVELWEAVFVVLEQWQGPPS